LGKEVEMVPDATIFFQRSMLQGNLQEDAG